MSLTRIIMIAGVEYLLVDPASGCAALSLLLQGLCLSKLLRRRRVLGGIRHSFPKIPQRTRTSQQPLDFLGVRYRQAVPDSRWALDFEERSKLSPRWSIVLSGLRECCDFK